MVELLFHEIAICEGEGGGIRRKFDGAFGIEPEVVVVEEAVRNEPSNSPKLPA